jgi:hypothetical protein
MSLGLSTHAAPLERPRWPGLIPPVLIATPVKSAPARSPNRT